MSDTPKIYAALVKAQGLCKPVEKDGKNSFHKYDYVTAEAMIEDCKAALNACGLATLPMGWKYTSEIVDMLTPDGEPYKESRQRIGVSFWLVHDNGETIQLGEYSISVVPEKGRPIDKAESAARTYILSYFLRDLLLVPRIDKGSQVDERDDTQWQPGYPSPKGQATTANANATKAQAPEMAERAQAIQKEMLAAPDMTKLEEWRTTAKKEMRGQYLEACKQAYSRRHRELDATKQQPQTNGTVAA